MHDKYRALPQIAVKHIFVYTTIYDKLGTIYVGHFFRQENLQISLKFLIVGSFERYLYYL